MVRSNLPGVSILLLLAALVSAPATAQEDLLSRAEQAYVEVNFAAALSLADDALETGAYGPRELERIYRLIGVAATASGDDERAVTAYVRLFALNPEAQLDENLSPRLRQPFLEALGRWTALRGRLGIQLRRLRDSRGLGLTLEDPISLVARVVVFSRVEGRGDELVRTELATGEPLAVSIVGLSPDDSVEVYAHALDAHGNRVLELGSAVEPHVLEGEAATAEQSTAVAASSPPTTPAPSPGLSPWFFVTGAALTAVSAAVLSWSIVDVVESHDGYLAEPTLDKYYQGLDLQTRTNALIITTSALGIASAVLAIFTEWSTPAVSTESARMHWTLFASPTAAGAAATGSF